MVKTFIDFCAGIGAGRLGLEKNGLKCVGYCEIDKYAIETYRLLHNTNNEINFGDLTKIDAIDLPNFDIMIAGFPCQTFSIVGQRKGFEDDRGKVVYSLIKILKAKNVAYFILENVKGLQNHNNGKTINIILDLLVDAGYKTEYKVLNSLDYGVPQMRERVYFVGIRKDLYKNKIFEWPQPIKIPKITKYLIDENNELSKEALNTFYRYLENKYNIGKFRFEQLVDDEYSVLDARQSDLRIYSGKIPTLRAGRQGIYYVRDSKLRRLTGYEGLLLQGFDFDYADKTKGIVNSRLLTQVGNAMTVTTIFEIGKALLEYIE